jgi:hypothetical protein
MPIKVNVGLSQKIGQPDYGSLGATCHVEFEADSHLLQNDLDGFHRHVANAFVACKQAVQDELSRHQHGSVAQTIDVAGSRHASGRSNGHANGHINGQRRSTARKATVSQVRAIESIANRLQLDLTQWLQSKYGLRLPGELSISDASAAIDDLKASTNGSQKGGAY